MLAMRVAGMKKTEAMVNIFVVLFSSRLMRPRAVSRRKSRRSKLKSAWLTMEFTSRIMSCSRG